jgi:3' terminal RNA ribose 2'-O-methyltransferase Hen1
VLLTITNTRRPAADLGYLLHKHPDRHQTFPLSFGKAHVFYPEAGPERCTAALLLDIDPIALVRGRKGSPAAGPLAQYVNDRPYVASSLLSVAIGRVFGSAKSGRSEERPELAAAALPLCASVALVPCRGGEEMLRRLFEPLGYAVAAEQFELDPDFPQWGQSPYYRVELRAEVRLCDLLTHLYVLVPVLDDEKHYWVGDDEVEKLLRHGEGWLGAHPERELIARRYLKHQRSLACEALARLSDEDGPVSDEARGGGEAELEQSIDLAAERLQSVLAAIKGAGARRVLDLGCGEGRLLKLLMSESAFQEIVGMDVSSRALEVAYDRLRLDRLPVHQQGRVRLMQGSLVYRDERLAGYDAAAVVEVIEHLDPPRLAAFERVVFAFARPGTVVLTTPNADYNVKWEGLRAGEYRHRDHRFEWTRAQFQHWADEVARRHGYAVRCLPIGPEDPQVGPPTQMAVFTATPATSGRRKPDSP